MISNKKYSYKSHFPIQANKKTNGEVMIVENTDGA